MSSQEISIDTVISETEPASPPLLTRRKHLSPRAFLPLWLCLLLALAVRIYLVVHTGGAIDGDEAVVGIQAQHILQGVFPVYFAGQPYMGSLEAYLMAILFAVVGSSVWALRAEPILLSLVVVWLVWRLAGILAERATLPLFARKLFQTIAALLVAIPPLYDTVAEMHALGGYIEVFVLMLLLLLSTIQLTRRWQSGASTRELAWRWAGIGFIVGLGLWTNPLIISAILASIIWLAGTGILALLRWKRQTPEQPEPRFTTFVSRSLLALLAIPAALIGCAPALYWGATHQWQNISYALNLSTHNTVFSPATFSQHSTRLAMTRALLTLYQSCVAPRVISGGLPLDNSLQLNLIHLFTLTLGLCCLLFTLAVVALSYLPIILPVKPHPLLVQARHLGTLPLIFGASTSLLFIGTSTAATGIGSPCMRDLTGRYASPLFLALPFFYATTFTIISLCIYKLYQKYFTKQPSLDEAGNSQPFSTRDLATNRLHAYNHTVIQILFFSLLFAACILQTYAYGLSDAGHIFQSPYCLEAPTDNAPIIQYLQQQHIHYA